MPNLKSLKARSRLSHHGVVALATFWSVLSGASAISAQTGTGEEPPANFGEISNKPTASSTAAPDAAPAPPTAPVAVAPAEPAQPAVPALAASAPATAPTVAAPPSAECKQDWLRDGFYLRIMIGMGYARFAGKGPSGSASVTGLGSTSIIAIGGAVAPGLVVAGTIQGTTASGKFKGGPFATSSITSDGEELAATKSATAALSQIGAMLDWYPSATNGAHLGFSVGLGATSVVNQIDNSTYSGMSGAGTLLAGYDWPISRAWALGLALVATGSTKTSLKHAKTGHDAGYDLTPFSIGLSMSILYF
jgi:hypothetical protein